MAREKVEEEFPVSVVDIVKRVAREYPNDAPRALEEAQRQVHELPEYAGLVAQLVRKALQDLIDDVRRRGNVQAKKEAGMYGGEAKIKADSASVRAVYARVSARMKDAGQTEALPSGAKGRGKKGKGNKS
jgi:hypothetical protein